MLFRSDLAWGTSGAQTVTLSFWVNCSIAGTWGGSITNGNENYCYPFSYTVNATNTWEYKTVTISGPTGGTWASNNTSGIKVFFTLALGSTYTGTAGVWGSSAKYGCTGTTSLVGTSGATLYLAGVQFEAGSAATPFENRLYTTELQLCQRYFWMQASGSNKTIACGAQYNSSVAKATIPLKVSMRTTPTLYSNSGANYFIAYGNASANYVTSFTLDASSTPEQALIYCTNSMTGGWAIELRVDSASAYIGFSAEL